jgi:RNA polymerase sigma factor (sigma-70 family)
MCERFAVPFAQNEEQAWDEFLNEYAPLVLQVVQLFTHDQDQIHDCFVFCCEKLKEHNLKRLRSFDAEGPASFATWLRAVVRNLCLDWHRKRFGRPRLYRSIARLPVLDREVFRSIHLRQLSESETFHTVKALHPSLTPDGFAQCLIHIEKALSPHQSWLLTTSTPRMVSLSNSPADPAVSGREREIADSEPNPEEEASRSEYLAALRRALDHLPMQQRLVVRLRFEQELSLDQIANLTLLEGPRAVQGLLQKAVTAMREEITADISTPVSVKDS